ncbi:hypothetical protein G5714_001526 [Onychostoma macrolepis]|uniref:Uncharacterized protein n=1 Tax=Onychostoma macrolepis TaxID=369639 RepID=A0A7J6DCF3_9TELE|nr:hypothetical protein G5714_001526 [Onychostoma macrolepis]
MFRGTSFENIFSVDYAEANLIHSKDSCQTGVLIPVPTYTSFTLALEELEAAIIPYYLCEEQGWTLQVYQSCMYGDNTEFYSYKKVLSEMGSTISSTAELASFNYVSKSFMGE